MRDYIVDIFHQDKIGINPLRGFFSPHIGEIYTQNVSYACLLLFWFFQSPTAEMPAWVSTLNTSNDAVLRKDDPFDSYRSEFSYLTDFFLKNRKNTIVSMGKF